MFFISYNVDPPIANSYNHQRHDLERLLGSISGTQKHYIDYVLNLSSAGLIVGLPTSPTHFLLALKLSPSYWDFERNMIYVYYNADRPVVFLGALFRILGKVHFYSLSNSRDNFLFSFVGDVFGYFVEFSMGIKNITYHQAKKLVNVLLSSPVSVGNIRLAQDLAAKALAFLLVKSYRFDLHRLARIFGREPKLILDMGRNLEGELGIAWKNAVSLALGNAEGNGEGVSDELMEILSGDELDKLTYDLIVALASLLQYVKVKGLDFVKAKYSSLIDRLTSFDPLREFIVDMLRDPNKAIEQLNSLLPGLADIVNIIHPEAVISQILEISP